MGCHFLLQGIFATQGSNPHLLLGRWVLYHRATSAATTDVPDDRSGTPAARFQDATSVRAGPGHPLVVLLLPPNLPAPPLVFPSWRCRNPFPRAQLSPPTSSTLPDLSSLSSPTLDDFHPILKKIIYVQRALKSLRTLTSLLFSRSFLAILPTGQTHCLPGSTPQHLAPLNTLRNVLP